MVSFTIPIPKNRLKKARPPVVIKYIFIKSEKKPTAYKIKKADDELKVIIQDLFAKDNISDMIYWDKNVLTIENEEGWFETIVYRGIYIITK